MGEDCLKLVQVVDDKGDFAVKRCNTASVDLVELGDDEALVRSLVEKHVAATGSPRGQWVLENWSQMLPKFVKIFPRDLRALMSKANKEAVHA